MTEFVLQLKIKYLQHPFPQAEIQQAITTHNIGQLTRLFDKMPVSKDAMAEAYQCIQEAADINQIEAHLRDLVISISGSLFNEKINDCNEETIRDIGKENYAALLNVTTKLGASKQILMDKILQAIIVSYAQTVTHHFATLTNHNEKILADEHMKLSQSFNTKIMLPMELCITKITSENLFDAFHQMDHAQNVDWIRSSMERLSFLIRDFRDQLETLKTSNLPDIMDSVTITQKKLRIQLDRLAEWQEKLSYIQTPEYLKRALEFLNEFQASLQDMIHNDPLYKKDLEPLTIGWIEFCIDTAAWIFSIGNIRYQSKETQFAEMLQSTKTKIQFMKAALEEIKTSHQDNAALTLQT